LTQPGIIPKLVGERNVATNLGINSRLCQRILF